MSTPQMYERKLAEVHYLIALLSRTEPFVAEAAADGDESALILLDEIVERDPLEKDRNFTDWQQCEIERLKARLAEAGRLAYLIMARTDPPDDDYYDARAITKLAGEVRP
jgi:hypothetical protein